MNDPLYSIWYENTVTHHAAALPGGLDIPHATARQRASSWCAYMTSIAPRGVDYVLGAWVTGVDDYGTFERAEVHAGPAHVGAFVVREGGVK